MSEPIKVGDLVMIVRLNRCGCQTKHLGNIFVVAAISPCRQICGQCGKRYSDSSMSAEDSKAGHRAQLWRLKRIDPLPEKETEKRDEEITA